jgi:hypothetical protein
MNDQDRKFTGRAFMVLFLLAFIYMGALSAALEGWSRTYTVLSYTGLTVLLGSTVYCIIDLFTNRKD